MSEHFEAFSEWVSTIREDVETLKTIVGTEGIDDEARALAAAGLNYVVTRMDLVPDWEESIGVLDDVFVLRLCVDLGLQVGLEEGLEDADAIARVGRLSNEAKRIAEFLDAELESKLRKHCGQLVEQSVRGRSPRAIVADPAMQQALFAEVDAEIRRIPAAPFADPDALTLTFRSYLHNKLNR